MRIDQSATTEAFSKLGDNVGDVQGQLAVGVLKDVVDSAETATMQLLQSLQPHLGQNVDVRL